MTEDDPESKPDLSRRLFMRETVVGGTAAAVAASGTAAAQEEDGNESDGNESDGEGGGNESDGEGGGNESDGEGGGGNVEPAWSEFVTGANNYDGTEDMRGQGEVTVDVGAGDGLAFGPAAIWIDTGTTVIWEWTGEGGGHNVAAVEGGDFASDISSEEGFTFEQTFEEAGIIEYECEPHTGQGMHGGVAVGEDIETQEVQESGGGGGGGGGGVQLPGAARAVGVALTVALGSTLGLAYVFMKYGGDYEERVE